MLLQERPDGSVEKRSYDKDGHLTKQENRAGDGTLLYTVTYAYDRAGNGTE